MPEGFISHPFESMVLDYAWKGYVPDSKWVYFSPEIYRMFLRLFREDYKFRRKIVGLLNENVECKYATHPDFLGAVHSIRRLPLSPRPVSSGVYGKLSMVVGSDRYDERFRREVRRRQIYQSTYEGRYTDLFPRLFQQFGTPGHINVVEFGSGEKCFALKSFIECAEQKGIQVDHVLAVEPHFKPVFPYELEIQSFTGVREPVHPEGLLPLYINPRSRQWLEQHGSNSWFLFMNTQRPQRTLHNRS